MPHRRGWHLEGYGTELIFGPMTWQWKDDKSWAYRWVRIVALHKWEWPARHNSEVSVTPEISQLQGWREAISLVYRWEPIKWLTNQEWALVPSDMAVISQLRKSQVLPKISYSSFICCSSMFVSNHFNKNIFKQKKCADCKKYMTDKKDICLSMMKVSMNDF